ncbi:protein of unknown function [Pseudomonas sp. JV241A]|nr:protein of unknown function [Pseudomonas sp. JV241A]
MSGSARGQLGISHGHDRRNLLAEAALQNALCRMHDHAECTAERFNEIYKPLINNSFI